MNDPRHIFGHRLAQARRMRGLSLRGLADLVQPSLSHNALHKYEQGAMLPDSGVLLSLCRALGQKPDFFLRPPTVALGEVEFRKRRSLGVRQIESLREHANDFFERYVEIETLLGLPHAFSNPLAGFEIHEEGDVEQAANRLRDAWKLGRGPLPSVVALLEEQGLLIYETAASASCDGFAGHAGERPVIVLRRDVPLDRKRLTALHELGHLLLVFHDGLFAAKDCERLCSRFASAVLMPQEEFEQAFGGHRTRLSKEELVAIKERYGISCQAVMARAHQLGLVSASTYRGFCIRWNTWGFRATEPGAYQGDESARRFEALVYRAFAEEAISASKAANLLGRPLAELEAGLQVLE
ncbi:MAG: ImmA/IrrE family metallo-endopeptidase [Verrucomicrobia bacterium]|nr:ImmA/IrrE family metallo-endopeptidase [Verrucomicrobiota bacterium]